MSAVWWFVVGYFGVGAFGAGVIGYLFTRERHTEFSDMSWRRVIVGLGLTLIGWPVILCGVCWKLAEGTRSRGRLERASVFLGHHAIGIGVALTATVGLQRLFVPPVWWSLVLSVVLVAVGFWWMEQMGRHGFKMCVECATEMPANPQDALNRRRSRLRAFHWLIDGPTWRLWVIPAAVIAISFADVLGEAGRWVSALVWTPILYQTVITTTHHRLRPWCPQCRDWGDGGEREVSPTPDPSGVKVS